MSMNRKYYQGWIVKGMSKKTIQELPEMIREHADKLRGISISGLIESIQGLAIAIRMAVNVGDKEFLKSLTLADFDTVEGERHFFVMPKDGIVVEMWMRDNDIVVCDFIRVSE